jgi:CheY-like chemotaxis protein
LPGDLSAIRRYFDQSFEIRRISVLGAIHFPATKTPRNATLTTGPQMDLPTSLRKTASHPMSFSEPTAPNRSAKKPAILLIDDEKPLLDVFAAGLAPFFNVTLAYSVREADLALEKATFKVVVTDHLMPGGNGMNFLTRARDQYPHMQRVLVTGYLKPEMLMRSVNEAGLFRYLLKPVAISELVRVVQEAVKAHDLSASAA